MRLPKLMAGAALVLVLAACGRSGKDIALQVKSPDDAKAQATAIAQQVFDDSLTGATRKELGLSAAPCQGQAGETADDGRFSVMNTWNIFAPADKIDAMIDAMSAKWRSRGWQITEDGRRNGIARTVTAKVPPDDFEVSVWSNGDGSTGVMILSKCLKPPRRDMVDF